MSRDDSQAGAWADFAGLSVLLLDDDGFVRGMTHRMLTTIGVRDIRQAASAADALEIAVRPFTPLDVVISDLDMPGVDGMEFLRLLSQHRRDAHVLIVSSQGDGILRGVEVMAEEYGLTVLGVLAKPITVRTLREKLSGYVPRSAPRGHGGGSVSPNEVREGLARLEFEPFFQPKVDLVSRRIRGAEALVRWRHPTRGVLPPGLFVPVAEAHGLMDELTLTVLEQSATQMRRWNGEGLSVPVSVNVSQSSLADPRFSSLVIAILARHHVSPEMLTVEVTETVAMTDIAHCLETLVRLRMHGVGLSIDDFGTGHASLQQLTRVPFTELKIDQAFVTGAGARPRLRAIVESSIAMAKRLGLVCAAEGVETREDWNFLHELGCDMGQGYFIARPMEPAQLREWLRQ